MFLNECEFIFSQLNSFTYILYKCKCKNSSISNNSVQRKYISIYRHLFKTVLFKQ